MKPEISARFFHRSGVSCKQIQLLGFNNPERRPGSNLLHTVRMHAGERRPTIIKFSKSITEQSSYHTVSRKCFKTIHF